MDPVVDQIRLNFNPASLVVLNAVLGLVMFGVALDLRVEDFRRVVRAPKGPLLGLTAQFLLLPAMTFALTRLLDPAPSMALGMLMVGCCPGGNISNFLAVYGGGNGALSVSMTAISTLAAIVLTPLNLAFWAGQHSSTAALMTEIAIDPMQMLLTIGMILGLPLAAGMTVAARAPRWAERLRRPMKVLSLVIFGGFIAGALAANHHAFMRLVGMVAVIVAIHNASALTLGYGTARLGGLSVYDARAIAVEVGIQNSGLGLVLIFTFFDGLGGMAIVAAWWGVWHIIAGVSLATYWSRIPAAGRPQEVFA